MTAKGIDISGWNGEVDFQRVKADGIAFVIVKAGYSLSAVDTWERNYANAKAAGLHVGAYWYSYAKTAAEAKNEARSFIAALKGKQLDYPVYFDLEEKFQLDKGRAFCSEITDAFCGALRGAGYLAGLYISRSPLQDKITPEVAKKYELWVAEWGSKCRYDGDYGVWQYSETGRVNGISGNVDLDYCYKDYPTIIKSGGCNGYPQTGAKPVKTVGELAREVLDGKWGNGEERKRRLAAAGYDYGAVQGKVNELLRKPSKTVDELAREVIRGDWGNGDERKKRLTAAGYDYSTVQKKVTELMK
ncbi:MAG: 1,4-beta-N-acetylmuramidase [Ruminococcus sp.]|nr:1,4-beta-N-acetylmuramidase [Ruminococcus sp.]